MASRGGPTVSPTPTPLTPSPTPVAPTPTGGSSQSPSQAAALSAVAVAAAAAVTWEAAAFAAGAGLVAWALAGRGSRVEEARRAAWEDRKPVALVPWAEVSGEDWGHVVATRALLARSRRPAHSDFLVAAAVSYWDGGGAPDVVYGVNSETCVVGSSLCAERCAMLQLRLAPRGYRNIRAVYITTSVPELITPGVLCREFMSEFGPPETRVLLFTSDWVPDVNPVTGRRTMATPPAAGTARMCRLGDLYPHASIYHTIPRSLAPMAAAAFAAAAQPLDEGGAVSGRGFKVPREFALGLDVSVAAITSSGGMLDAEAGLRVIEARIVELYHRTRAAAAAPARANGNLHPLHYAAGILFGDGEMVVARTDIGLEYGCTVDGAVKLTAAVVAARESAGGSGGGGGGAGGGSGDDATSNSSGSPSGDGGGVRPMVLLHVDQYGVCHAPNAVARAWYRENGYGDLVVFLHARDPTAPQLSWQRYGRDAWADVAIPPALPPPPPPTAPVGRALSDFAPSATSTAAAAAAAAMPRLPYPLPRLPRLVVTRTTIADLCPAAPHIAL